MEKVPESPHEKPKNSNSIGELMGFKEGLPTSEDFVYRYVSGNNAIQDLLACGFVRNKANAQGEQSKRWGDNVYWSRGKDGLCHNVSEDSYVIVAPYDIASEETVRLEDVSAIYTKDTSGQIIDILPTLI